MRKIVLCSLFTILSLVLLTGCGNDLKKYAGTYKLEYSKFVGDPDTAKNTTDFAEMILNSDGTGKSNRDGLNINIEWSMNGDNITLIETFMGMKIEYNGTLKDGKLDLFNGDRTDELTNEKVYNKE